MIPDLRTQQPFFPENTIKKMMQPERFLPSWESFNLTGSNLDQSRFFDPQMDFFMRDDLDFSSSFTSPEEFSVISSNSHIPTMFSDEYFDLQKLCDEIPITSPMEGLETISSGEIADICRWINERECEGNFSAPITMDGEEHSPCFSLESSDNSVVIPLTNKSEFPGVMEIDNETSLHHLIRAYGEATENGQKDLSQVIVNSIEEKSDPLGKTMERVAFYLFQLKENQGDYIRQESLKNFRAAFRAFYEGLPYGRFAHFTANSAILEAMPDDAATMHIVDFDIGEGMQWPPVIEAIGQMNKALRFTLIKSDDECNFPCWEIEDTKKRLQYHAREFGLNLQIEVKSVSELASDLTRTKKRGRGSEWLVFNCMFRLPHMAKRRQRSDAMEFLKVAKEILANYGASAGMVTLGHGETEFCSRTSSGFSSFLDKLLKHYQALFESLEQIFPVRIVDARTAVECLFLASYTGSLAWFQDSEELMKNSDLLSETRLEGHKLSQENLVAAKQIVNERENLYKVKIEGYRDHEMVLEWKGTPLVRVSTWM